MRYLITFLLVLAASVGAVVAKKEKVIKITVQPKEAAIYVNNTLQGYGYAEFARPKKKNDVAIIRIECTEYQPILTKFYGGDPRTSLSFSLMQDGFYRASAASGIVNKFFTIDIDSMYYKVEGDKVDVSAAWKLLHEILLNYFDEISTTDIYGGYLQTPWQYKQFTLSDKQIRNRVTVRDISNPKRVAFQIKISSEVAGSNAARHGEFTEVDRIPKEFEPIIQELQTRIGKVNNL